MIEGAWGEACSYLFTLGVGWGDFESLLQSSPSKKTKPRQDKPIKKKRQSLKQIKESYLTQIAENKKQARGELPQGVTYEDFLKWGNLTKEDLREFCEKALNRAGQKI